MYLNSKEKSELACVLLEIENSVYFIRKNIMSELNSVTRDDLAKIKTISTNLTLLELELFNQIICKSNK